MEYNEDWCYFKLLDTRQIGRPIVDTYTCNLVAVCNALGFMLIASENRVHMLSTHSLRDFVSESPPEVLSQLEKPFEVLFLSISSRGDKFSISGSNQVSLHDTNRVKSGNREAQTNTVQGTIKQTDWVDSQLGVLTVEGNLLLFDESGLQPGGFPSLTCFACISGRLVGCGELGLMIFDIASKRTINQVPTENFLASCVISLNDSRLIVYGVLDNIPTLKIYKEESLEELETVEDIDFLPMSPPDSQGDLNNFPISGFLEYIPTRKTLIFSSTCQEAVHVIYEFQDQCQVTNWEERMNEKCQLPWEKEAGYQHLARGMALVTSITATSETINFPIKDFEITLKFPPLLLLYGSDGFLYLYQFIDLRLDFQENSLITSSQLISGIPIQNSEERKEIGNLNKPLISQESQELQESAPVNANLAAESTVNLPPVQEEEEVKIELTPMQKEKAKLRDFTLEYFSSIEKEIDSVKLYTGDIEKEKNAVDELERNSRSESETIKKKFEKYYLDLNSLLENHLQSKSAIRHLDISLKSIQQTLDNTDHEEADPRLKSAVEFLDVEGQKLYKYLNAMEKIQNMYNDQAKELGINKKSGLPKFQVIRPVKRPTPPPAAKVHTLSTEYLQKQQQNIENEIRKVETQAMNKRKEVICRDQTRIAFDDIDEIEIQTEPVEDFADIQSMLKDNLKFAKIKPSKQIVAAKAKTSLMFTKPMQNLKREETTTGPPRETPAPTVHQPRQDSGVLGSSMLQTTKINSIFSPKPISSESNKINEGTIVGTKDSHSEFKSNLFNLKGDNTIAKTDEKESAFKLSNPLVSDKPFANIFSTQAPSAFFASSAKQELKTSSVEKDSSSGFNPRPISDPASTSKIGQPSINLFPNLQTGNSAQTAPQSSLSNLFSLNAPLQTSEQARKPAESNIKAPVFSVDLKQSSHQSFFKLTQEGGSDHPAKPMDANTKPPFSLTGQPSSSGESMFPASNQGFFTNFASSSNQANLSLLAQGSTANIPFSTSNQSNPSSIKPFGNIPSSTQVNPSSSTQVNPSSSIQANPSSSIQANPSSATSFGNLPSSTQANPSSAKPFGNFPSSTQANPSSAISLGNLTSSSTQANPSLTKSFGTIGFSTSTQANPLSTQKPFSTSALPSSDQDNPRLTKQPTFGAPPTQPNPPSTAQEAFSTSVLPSSDQDNPCLTKQVSFGAPSIQPSLSSTTQKLFGAPSTSSSAQNPFSTSAVPGFTPIAFGQSLTEASSQALSSSGNNPPGSQLGITPSTNPPLGSANPFSGAKGFPMSSGGQLQNPMKPGGNPSLAPSSETQIPQSAQSFSISSLGGQILNTTSAPPPASANPSITGVPLPSPFFVQGTASSAPSMPNPGIFGAQQSFPSGNPFLQPRK